MGTDVLVERFGSSLVILLLHELSENLAFGAERTLLLDLSLSMVPPNERKHNLCGFSAGLSDCAAAWLR